MRPVRNRDFWKSRSRESLTSLYTFSQVCEARGGYYHIWACDRCEGYSFQAVCPGIEYVNPGLGYHFPENGSIDHSRNTITYHNALCLSPKKFYISIVFSFSWGHFNSQEKLKTMLMQNFGVTKKEHYGMLWYFLEWSIGWRF